MRHLIIFPTFLFVIIMSIFAPDAYSQNPTFNMTLANGKQVSSKVFEVDIYMLSTSAPIELATFSLGISFNNAIKGNGTLMPSWVPSSSQLSNLAELPTALNTSTAGVIKIAGKIPPGAGSGSIISNISPGTKIGRLQLTNSSDFVSGQQMNFIWLMISPYPTTVNAYVGNVNTNITSVGIYNDYQLTIPSEVETEITGIPINFAISQNYPNPFNPSTKINYQVPTDARVILEVYNIAGQKVAELVNQDQHAGYYTVDFGTTAKLASGIYIYRITASDKATGNNFSDTKKMMLLK
jgi:Secretion system C-terminal sorting domain